MQGILIFAAASILGPLLVRVLVSKLEADRPKPNQRSRPQMNHPTHNSEAPREQAVSLVSR